LVRKLLEGRDAALALIVAPAGYGKSTLLADWAACDERPFVWITLAGYHDANAVARLIAQAFEEAGWIDRVEWAALIASLADYEIAGLRSLMRSLDRSQHSFVLVLDDAHAVPPPALRSVIEPLLPQLPAGAQIAIGSRVEPPLSIGRLRGHRNLVEVRAADLAMAPAEAAALLRGAGAELEFGTVQALTEQTEGWPVGLYLAALSLRARGGSPAPGGLDPNDHIIAEYFRDEFLAPLGPETRSFITRSAVLDELSAPACDVVLGQRGSARILDELGHSNLMIVALDDSHRRWRWHNLFSAVLSAELRRTEPELEPDLHRRASAWSEQHGDLHGAIGHAVRAGDPARAGELLCAQLAHYLATGRIGLVQEWLQRFSVDQIARHAPLALAAAHCALMRGSVEQARHWGSVARDASGQAGSGAATLQAGSGAASLQAESGAASLQAEGGAASLRAESGAASLRAESGAASLQAESGAASLQAESGAASVQAGIAIIEAVATRSNPAQIHAAATRAYDVEPTHGSWRPLCCLLLGVAEHLAGRRQTASDRFEEGLALSAVGLPSVASLCLSQLSMLAIEQDEWIVAGEYAEQAAEIAQQPSLAGYPISAHVFAAAAATRAHRGRVDEAKRDLRHATSLLAALGDFIPWYGAEVRILLARAAIGLADTVRARTLLAEASRLARRTPDAVSFKRCFDQAWAEIDTLAETSLSGPSSLTIAELRILRFLPSHRSFREIAERLDVSVNTVKTQAHAIYRKLDATSRSEAVARATSAGLLGP